MAVKTNKDFQISFHSEGKVVETVDLLVSDDWFEATAFGEDIIIIGKDVAEKHGLVLPEQKSEDKKFEVIEQQVHGD